MMWQIRHLGFFFLRGGGGFKRCASPLGAGGGVERSEGIGVGLLKIEMYVCVCMHVCLYVCMHARMHACMNVCVHV